MSVLEHVLANSSRILRSEPTLRIIILIACPSIVCSRSRQSVLASAWNYLAAFCDGGCDKRAVASRRLMVTRDRFLHLPLLTDLLQVREKSRIVVG
jgi:hypothetical protein